MSELTSLAAEAKRQLTIGQALSSEDAGRLEKSLEGVDDIGGHLQLIGYYRHQQKNGLGNSSSILFHVIWVIDNHPEHPATKFQTLIIRESDGEQNYIAAKSSWIRHVENSNDPDILDNAANFFLSNSDFSNAEVALLKAKEIDEENLTWSSRLSRMYKIGSQSAVLNGDIKQSWALAALAECEHVYLNETDPDSKFHAFSLLPELAFCAEQFDNARQFAKEVEAIANNRPEDKVLVGFAIHNLSIVLGKLALKGGDVQTARAYLRKATNVPTSFILEQSGPNVSLAKELLRVGDKAEVILYLTKCKELCGTHKETLLDSWIFDVTNDVVPNSW